MVKRKLDKLKLAGFVGGGEGGLITLSMIVI